MEIKKNKQITGTRRAVFKFVLLVQFVVMYKKEIWVVALIIFGCKVTKISQTERRENSFSLPETTEAEWKASSFAFPK